MIVLFRNHYLNPEPVPTFDDADLFASVEPVERWKDMEEFMLIKRNERIIGATITKITKDPSPDTTMTYRLDFGMQAKLSPILPMVNVKIASALDSDMNLTNFNALGDLGVINLSISGFIADKILYARTVKNSLTNNLKLRLAQPATMAEALRPALGRRMKIFPGSKLTLPVIDPLNVNKRGTMTIEVTEKENVRVNGQDVLAYKAITTIGDIKSSMWVDDEGNTLKRQLVGNMVMERSTREKVLEYAPDLDNSIQLSQMELSDFSDVPTTEASSTATGASAGFEVIESLLK